MPENRDEPGMSTLEIDIGDLRARSVEFTATELVVTLADGRRITTPLAWYPRLQKASAAARALRHHAHGHSLARHRRRFEHRGDAEGAERNPVTSP